MKILNIGSCNIDHVYGVDVFTLPGETKQTLSYRKNAGGKGLNQSIAAAKAGSDIYHAGLIGCDGSFLQDMMEENGVNCKYLTTIASPGGHAIIEVASCGQNRIMLYPGTNFMLTEGFVDGVLSRFDAGDILIVQNEVNLVPYIIKEGYKRGLKIGFNASPVTADLDSYPLELVTWLFVNEIEGAAITGKTDPEEIAGAAAEKWSNTNLVLTLGTEGCIYIGDGEYFHTPAKVVKAVDTTAAGDTFTGFFVGAISRGMAPREAIEQATRASAIAVTRHGAAPSIPTLEEVLNYK